MSHDHLVASHFPNKVINHQMYSMKRIYLTENRINKDQWYFLNVGSKKLWSFYIFLKLTGNGGHL